MRAPKHQFLPVGRRTFLQLVAFSVYQAMSPFGALGGPASASYNLFLGRSGVFQNGSLRYLLIGGLRIPNDTAKAIEADLNNLASRLRFLLPLRFSTNKFAETFYRSSLEILIEAGEFEFSCVRIRIPDGGPDGSGAQRMSVENLERSALDIIINDENLLVNSLRYDYDGKSQRNIYKSTEESNPTVHFQIFDSTRASPRLLQLAGVIASCVNSAERLTGFNKGNPAKTAMVDATFKTFGLSGVDGDVTAPNFRLKHLSA